VDYKRRCLKQSVHAMIVTKDGAVFHGENWITAEIDECPRVALNYKSGQGYAYCRLFCGQKQHAEIDAINNAKKHEAELTGGKLFLFGHTYCCDKCLEALKEVGITDVSIMEN